MLKDRDWQLAIGNSSRQPTRKQFMDSPNLSDSKSIKASANMSMNEPSVVGSASIPSTSRAAEVNDHTRHSSSASALVELTTRLDFFKERRSQLMEQLHNLDLNYETSSQDFVYKPSSSPPWN